MDLATNPAPQNNERNPMATENEVGIWLEDALCELGLEKVEKSGELGDGKFILKKGKGRQAAQFADHMFWWTIKTGRTKQFEPLILRLNMFSISKENLPWSERIKPFPQLVAITPKGSLKGSRVDKDNSLRYDFRYLSNPIKSVSSLKEELKKLLENKGPINEQKLLTHEEWKDAKKESHRRNYIFSESPEGYEKAKKINEEGGDLELPNRDFLRLTPARYRIDTGTLNIHPPKVVLDKTLENLKKESNED